MRISDWSSDVCSSDLNSSYFRCSMTTLKPDDRHSGVCPKSTSASTDRDAGEIRGRINDHSRFLPLGIAVHQRIQIGRAHVCTPVTNAHLVCRLMLEKKKHTTLCNTNP